MGVAVKLINYSEFHLCSVQNLGYYLGWWLHACEHFPKLGTTLGPRNGQIPPPPPVTIPNHQKTEMQFNPISHPIFPSVTKTMNVWIPILYDMKLGVRINIIAPTFGRLKLTLRRDGTAPMNSLCICIQGGSPEKFN